MKKESSRILLHITVLPKPDEEARSFVDDIYLSIKNALNGYQDMPNVESLCRYCENKGEKNLAKLIRNQVYLLKKQETFFSFKRGISSRPYLSNIESSSKKDIRILLYPGERDNISDLKISETTHNMIIEYVQSDKCFFATEPHNNVPSFYQKCSSVDSALGYVEALIIDSCLCHYLGISDVAIKHDQKQKISRDKIDFLCELSQSPDFYSLSIEARQLIEYVLSTATSLTPYISLFSIFSIAVHDKFAMTEIQPFFDDFFVLFNLFQKWYFAKNGRLFSKDEFAQDAVKTVFDRNRYQGQISQVSFDATLNDKCQKLKNGLVPRTFNPLFGEEQRWAVVVIRHRPSGEEETKIFKTLFSGPIHPATVTITPWGNLDKYREIRHRILVLPIIIQ